METKYYETYNCDHVRLVDINVTPIQCVTKTGLKPTEKEIEFDIIVYATGFDAITGAFDRIDIRGIGGVALADKWKDGPTTFLGLIDDADAEGEILVHGL